MFQDISRDYPPGVHDVSPFSLLLRQAEDSLDERGIDISNETVPDWWNWFGPMFATGMRKKRSCIEDLVVIEKILAYLDSKNDTRLLRAGGAARLTVRFP